MKRLSEDERQALIDSARDGALSVTIPLRFPVPHLGQPLDKVTLRRVRVGDILDVGTPEQAGAKLEVGLLARISELGPDTIRSLDLSDYDVVTDVLAAFRY